MVTQIKNNPYKKRVVVVLIIMLAILGMGFLLNQERKNTVTKKRQLAELKNDLNRLDTLLQAYEQNAKELSQIERTLPKTYEEVAVVIAQFEEAAAQHDQSLDVQVKDLSHTEQGGVASIDVTLTTTGLYRNFSLMMSTISLLPYHTRLDALDVSGRENGLQNEAKLRVFIQDN